ncbi:MAG: hypothetical protein ACLTU1_16900 [Blautia wexlerae]
MAFGKKMSIDLSEDNKIKLEKIKAETRTPYGNTINTLIDTFCELPEELRANMIDFCKTKVQILLDQMDKSGAFEVEVLSAKIQKYMNIMTFFNNGNEIRIDQIKREPVMKTIPVKNGTVICPQDWIVVNLDQADQCEYAGVVECRNAERYGIPHFLFLTNTKYASDYSDQEIDHIDTLCAQESPLFAKALANQVSLIADPEHPGEYLNTKEHLASPFIGHFHLFEHGDPCYPADYKPPYGAMIVRNR